MTKQTKKPVRNRLASPAKIKPLDPGRRLAPYRVPDIPAGKFTDIPGQWALDLDSDDPDALVDPSL